MLVVAPLRLLLQRHGLRSGRNLRGEVLQDAPVRTVILEVYRGGVAEG